MKSRYFSQLAYLSILLAAYTASPESTTPAKTPPSTGSIPWVEETVSFTSGTNQLIGVLTLPNQPGPFPAIVLISGSANENTGLRSGVANTYLLNQARNMVKEGYAVLRYNPPGVDKSTGDSRFETLDDRVREAMAALKYLQTRPDIQADKVGLWGISQGGWVIEMAAAGNPQDVAFIISVSGAGVSVAEQQVWGVETQSRAAMLSKTDVSKAVLFARMLIDWQLSKPIYQEVNQDSAGKLGEGPWQDFMQLVYTPGEMTEADSLQAGIKILESIQDEPWAKALYLETLYLPQLRSISPEQLTALKTALKGYKDKDLLTDPKDFLPEVTCPVLAFFGEDDQLVPAQMSAKLYKQYLAQAANENFKIVVFPNAGHSLNEAMTDYWKKLSDWLRELY